MTGTVDTDDRVGMVEQVNGPVVRARSTRPLGMSELVWVGADRLVGEVIGLLDTHATVQVYEDTVGLKPGAPLYTSSAPLSVELGPGLLGNIFDGIQRPLEVLAARMGDFIQRGSTASALDHSRRWPFTPVLAAGTAVRGGEIVGTVSETQLIEHRILIPPNVSGTLSWVAAADTYTLNEPVARVDVGGSTREVRLFHRWPVRQVRPVAARHAPSPGPSPSAAAWREPIAQRAPVRPRYARSEGCSGTSPLTFVDRESGP